MSAFSDEMAALALELLTEFGELITIQRVAEGEYDPATGSVAAGTTTSYTGRGVTEDYRKNEIDGDVVKQDDLRLYLNATANEPLVGDRVTLQSKNFQIIDANRVQVNGVTVLYDLQLRV